MATGLIKEMVIPHFEEAGVDYAADEDCAVFRVPSESAGILSVAISEKGITGGVDMLEATVYGLIDVPEDRASVALEIANDLTRRAVGKFYIADGGGIAYSLDWNVPDRFNLEEVRTMLSLAIAAINHLHPIGMTALWGGISVDEAMERLKGDEEDDGGSDSGIMSDDDIRRLLDAG